MGKIKYLGHIKKGKLVIITNLVFKNALTKKHGRKTNWIYRRIIQRGF